MNKDRYAVALAKGRRVFDLVREEDRELLASYGLRLLSVQSGIRFAVEEDINGKVNPWDMIELTTSAWHVIRPLLVRLGEAEKELAEARNLRLCESERVVEQVDA